VILRGRTGDPNTRDPRFQEVDSLGEGRNDRNKVPLRHGRRSGTCSSSEDTTTSSRFVRPSAVPVSTPTFLEGVRPTTDILKPSLAKTGDTAERWFPSYLRGSHPPTQLPSHPDFTSLDLRALQAFAQYVYPSRHLVCTNTHILRHCSRCLIATDTRE